MTQCGVFCSGSPVPPACCVFSHRILSLLSSSSRPSSHRSRTSLFSILSFFWSSVCSALHRPARAFLEARYISFLSFFLLFSFHRFLREESLLGAGVEAAEEPAGTDLPFTFSTRLPNSPTLYQEKQPLPFLRGKTLFLIANEPVLENHVASNLLHQLLYALQIPNERVWLLDELLLQGPQNEKYATLLPWLVYTYYNLPPGVEYIWIGTAYSRVVGPALEELLRRLHAARISDQQTKMRNNEKEGQGHHEGQEEDEQHGEILSEQGGLCIGFGLKDQTPSARHHYYSDPEFIYPFLSAGLLVDNRFLRFLAHSVRDAAREEQSRKDGEEQEREGTAGEKKRKKPVTLPARIEIDPLHELFKFLYDKHGFLLTHSDLLCPDNPMPRTFDRTEMPYPAPHQRQHRPFPARTLLDIRASGNSRASTAAKKRGVVAGEREKGRTEKTTAPELTALRKAEAEIPGCVSFTVGSRHSPILSHQFFDRLMEYEEEKIVRKERLTQKYPIDSLLEPGSLYAKVEDEILNERPFFIVEPEDVFIAVKTHDGHFKQRLPLLKELWASQTVLAATAKKRAQQSQHILPFSDIPTAGNEEEELRALEDNMHELRIVFFADNPASLREDALDNEGQAEKGKDEKEEEAAASSEGKKPGAEKKSTSGKEVEERGGGRRDTNEDENKKKSKRSGKEENKERLTHQEIVGESLVRVPVSFPNEKRSLCEKMLGIMRHFYFKEKDRKFLVLVDDDTLLNVRHLLDLISLSLQPPIPARIFFRQALTDSNAIRQAHPPYQKLAAEIDAFMLPWKREHALVHSSEFLAAPTEGTSAAAAAAGAADTASSSAAGDGGERSTVGESNRTKKKEGKRSRKQEQQQLRDKQSESAALIRSYAAAAYSQAWKGLSASAAAAAVHAISPLYAGERYSFRHTAARFWRPPKSSRSVSEEDTSRHKRGTCRSSADTAEAEATRKNDAARHKGRGGDSSVGAHDTLFSSCSSLRPSSFSHAPFLPSSFAAVNELFYPGSYSYITGGGGIVLDRAAVGLVLKCSRCKCPADGTADDMLLGLWLQHLLRVPSVHASAFHQERPQEYHAAHLRQITPLSFHRIDRDVDATRREFQEYLNIGEGLNVGKFEEDDFQLIDWVDYDWQQVEDLLWHEADDNASDWLLSQAEEEDTEEREEMGGDTEEDDTEEEEGGEEMRQGERITEDRGKIKGENVRGRGEETPVRRKRKKRKRSKMEDVEKMDVNLPSVIQQILNDAAEIEGMKGLSSEEVARRLEQRAGTIDSESGSKEKYGEGRAQTRYEEETRMHHRQEEL